MKPLVIKLYKPYIEEQGNVVRINGDAMAKVKQATRMYGISAKDYVSRIISHYADDVEFEVETDK